VRFLAPIALLMALLAGPLVAHEDSEIVIKRDGTLVGLPKLYQPSSLKILFDGNVDSEHPIQSLSLTIGKNTVHIPRSLLALLRSQNLEALFANASWYHEEALLPHYLQIEFLDPGFDKQAYGNNGFLMQFNMHTGKLISMSRIIFNKDELSTVHKSMKLSDYCTPSELSEFFDPWRIKAPKRNLK